jgi:hypothetical protein
MGECMLRLYFVALHGVGRPPPCGRLNKEQAFLCMVHRLQEAGNRI